MGMDLCQLQLLLQQQVEQYMIAGLAVADMWMEEMVCSLFFALLIVLGYHK
jgi:hypothetical protein